MILVIDNYDSFTYNLVQYLGELGEDPVVRRNDALTLDDVEALAPTGIVISPGPGVPADAGVTVPLIKRWSPSIPTLGVCLGHQAIAEAFGGTVTLAPVLMHGKTSSVSHDGKALFHGIPSPLRVMRYHSLTVERDTLPDQLEVIAWGEDDSSEIHALRHKEHPVWGVQFHPESVMTEHGREILGNFLTLAR
jgi:anthranilate synthase/aminodeoxychorismate synthase-like glutamine amidotransferase